MDRKLESQMDRVVIAVREAANRKWGSEETRPDRRTPKLLAWIKDESLKVPLGKAWVKGAETPKQKIAREYLEKHPDATGPQVTTATGVSMSVANRAKRRMVAARKAADGRKQ